jgi:hypothetical protein
MRGLLALSMVWLLACSSGSGSNGDGGPDAGGSTVKSCVDIRRCTVEALCADEACVNTCKERGSAAAQAAFDALEQCTNTTAGCARNSPDYMECFCKAQCREDYTCADPGFLDACLDGTSVDQVCETFCF